MGLLTNYLEKKFDSGKSGNREPSSGAADGGLLDRYISSQVPSFHKGGIVKKTGLARLKKGERVLTKAQRKKHVKK